MSQAPVVIVQGAAPVQQPTAIQTVPQGQPLIQVRRSDRLRYLSAHRGFGITHMIFGSIAFLLSVIGFGIIGPYWNQPYVGVWAGLWFFITGLLGVLAHKKESRCLIIACMVMNIIGPLIAVIGANFSVIFIGTGPGSGSPSEYREGKSFAVMAICIIEGIISIVHASFTCASCCPCCLPRETVYASRNASGAVVVQQRPQAVVAQPSSQANGLQRQVYLYQGYMPQPQNGQQPLLPGQQVVLPGQPYSQYSTQAVYPQQHQMSSPAVNPAFTHDGAAGATASAPPPYSEIAEQKYSDKI